MRRLLGCLALSLVCGLGTSARAGDVMPGGGLISEFKIGALAHDVPDLWSGFQVENPGVDVNAEVLLHPLYASSISMLRPAIGATVNLDGQTSHGYVDIRWQVAPRPLWYFAFGIGAAYNNGEIGPGDANRKWLGSHLLFHPSAEIGLNLDAHNNLSVFFEHMSNADTAAHNEGMDDFGVRYGYKF